MVVSELCPLQLQASWNGINFYEDALISDCVEELPLSPAPTMATMAVVVSLSVTIAIVGVACLALLCVLGIICWKRKVLRQFVKSKVSIIVYKTYYIIVRHRDQGIYGI